MVPNDILAQAWLQSRKKNRLMSEHIDTQMISDVLVGEIGYWSVSEVSRYTSEHGLACERSMSPLELVCVVEYKWHQIWDDPKKLCGSKKNGNDYFYPQPCSASAKVEYRFFGDALISGLKVSVRQLSLDAYAEDVFSLDGI